MDQRTRAILTQQITPKKFERLQWDHGLRERKTMTDYLAAALRTAIYDGQFADGEELNQVELAQFFGVSRVPIREALRQLQAEGLVQNIAHHRTIVAGLTLPQITELIEMRAVLESYMLRKSAPKLDKAVLDRIRRICNETDTLKDYGARWVVKNWEFHRTLYAAADSQAMVEAVERIHLKIERYARQAGTAERQREAAAEHRLIFKAIARGDHAKAATLLEQHILHTGEVIRRHRALSEGRPLARARAGRRRTALTG
ncbi:MAG: GntR family transcriptional regulator [Alphaproteobacteria bacterium]|nr:MAG: GntR family transcriptional regulator [Alphaproteobacteria bacterium]